MGSLQPGVQRLRRDQPLEDFVRALEQDGCVIVSDFTTPEVVSKANAEVQPFLHAQGLPGAKVGALAGKTQTVNRLIGRSKTVREKFFSDPLYQELCEHFLAMETTAWYGDEARTNKSHPLLSIAITFDIPPGTPAQGLHRDDKNHHARHPPTDRYYNNRDMLLGLFVPGCDTFKANGATRIVPGSHLWGDDKPDFSTISVTDAEMNVGEAFIMLGSLYHGAGSYPEPLGINSESGRESRTVHAMFSCSGVHRQEEISFLSYPIEEVKTYSKLVQDRLGWKQSEPNLGWVDLRSPEFMLE
ncbi:uncharacterized protein HMPREF1541_07077 [Cyphellophora europaea CBS 101466]|uniref:Phytanoyl-CoA dioxygenase n=1 Tax=Cyphellophora europaea (strain CBS 101466) TaxID=1220924 RepID=W2RRU4_CYPE1|nr:uncharacterized protein HMPREF1541_07077 [Cyphellophora europaea CBS 101466]ETN39035.1 hypothetical protein HMPREF1541_07077 [Cyphellophora europaea CBS 101466]